MRRGDTIHTVVLAFGIHMYSPSRFPAEHTSRVILPKTMAQNRLRVMIETIVLIAVGGFAGSALRYAIGLFAPGLGGTLLVNVVGSFALGIVLYEAMHTGLLGRRTRLIAATGFISSFTTYSTFAVEAALATPVVAVGYVAVSYAFGFAGVLAGRTIVLRFGGGGGE